MVIVTDCRPDDHQLQAMIARFRAVMPRKTRIVNIREYPQKGGCLGCFNCAVSGKCICKDGFDDYLRNEIQTTDSIVYAFTISDHSMGARFKMYDDRNFCNGHRTVTIGMPVGYLISGSYAREFNLQTIVEARAQVGHNYLAGVATDESEPDGQIDDLSKSLAYALENRYLPPRNFYGIGGMKVFRDLINAETAFAQNRGIPQLPDIRFGKIKGLPAQIIFPIVRSNQSFFDIIADSPFRQPGCPARSMDLHSIPSFFIILLLSSPAKAIPFSDS